MISLDDEHKTGSVTLENIPHSDVNGYKVTEVVTSRYELTGITGTNLMDYSIALGTRSARVISITKILHPYT